MVKKWRLYRAAKCHKRSNKSEDFQTVHHLGQDHVRLSLGGLLHSGPASRLPITHNHWVAYVRPQNILLRSTSTLNSVQIRLWSLLGLRDSSWGRRTWTSWQLPEQTWCLYKTTHVWLSLHQLSWLFIRSYHQRGPADEPATLNCGQNNLGHRTMSEVRTL